MADDAVGTEGAVATALTRARVAVRDTALSVRRIGAEVCVTLAVLGGWALVTLAIARLIRPDVVWPLSGGLLLLSLSGVRLLFQIVRDGLYLLTRGDS